MMVAGTARVDRRTKNLVTRLQAGEIAIILHEDLDLLAAENLVSCKPKCVINCYRSISGKYVNRGPYLLVEAGIPIVDDAGEELLNSIGEGAVVKVHDGEISVDGRVVGRGTLLNANLLNIQNQRAKERMEEEIDNFAANTLQFLKKEKSLLYSNLEAASLKADFRGRQVLVVVRGPEFKKDLNTIQQYIREQRPAIIGVDGGADAIIEAGFTPDIILGDMDSVSDGALRCGAQLVVHAYEGGHAPGMNRLAELSLEGIPVPSIGTSEDLALLLAHERNAELIVIVGSHFSMEEFLSKDRGGMASTFLTRLRVGSILVDAKGISRLYRNKVHPSLLISLIVAALFPVLAIFFVSPLGPLAKQFVRLIRLFFDF